MTQSHAAPSTELTDYERGYLDGMFAYAWWKDGELNVGTTGRTYKQAVAKFLQAAGKESWSAEVRRV